MSETKSEQGQGAGVRAEWREKLTVIGTKILEEVAGRTGGELGAPDDCRRMLDNFGRVLELLDDVDGRRDLTPSETSGS